MGGYRARQWLYEMQSLSILQVDSRGRRLLVAVDSVSFVGYQMVTTSGRVWFCYFPTFSPAADGTDIAYRIWIWRGMCFGLVQHRQARGLWAWGILAEAS